MARAKGHNWDKLYENYSKKFDFYENKLGKMAEKKLSPASFRNVYVNIENARKEEQAKGLRKQSLNVMRDIINSQKFPLTQKQASIRTKAMRQMYYKKAAMKNLSEAEFKKEMKKIDKQISYQGVRSGDIHTDEFWEEVKGMNKLLDKKMPDLSKADKRHIIAVTYFGSI